MPESGAGQLLNLPQVQRLSRLLYVPRRPLSATRACQDPCSS